MTKEVDRCNSCGKELKEDDGEYPWVYAFYNEDVAVDVQCIRLCEKCRAHLKEPPEIIEIRDIPFEQAKKEIDEYCANLKDEEVVYPSEIINILKRDLEQAFKAVDELIKEGKLEIAAEEENGKEDI